MIVLNLVCSQEHCFEGWFASADAFDQQKQQGLVACPVCDSADVQRRPSGPRIVSSRSMHDGGAGDATQGISDEQERLLDALKAYVNSSENVGERFPEEARRIHYREAPARAIRGVTSRQEAHELLEEGIIVLPVPFPPSEETH